jgi:hypothetical protein
MQSLAEAIESSLVDGQLPCAAAFAIAERLGVTPRSVGQDADGLGVRLSKCQLGLFGYGKKAEGTHRRVEPMHDVSADLRKAIRARLGADGKLPCAAAWRIADQLRLPRQTVSNAVEGLGLRIVECQLGAF